MQVHITDRTDIRSYSVVSSSEDGSLITISVLLTRTTRGGSQFMHGLHVGDIVLTTQPLENFPLRIGAERYVVVAGGIGITAVFEMASVLKALQANYGGGHFGGFDGGSCMAASADRDNQTARG